MHLLFGALLRKRGDFRTYCRGHRNASRRHLDEVVSNGQSARARPRRNVSDILDGTDNRNAGHVVLQNDSRLREFVDEFLLTAAQNPSREAVKVPENPEKIKALRKSGTDIEQATGSAKLQQTRADLLQYRLHVNSTGRIELS